jgi:hypothetical protein
MEGPTMVGKTSDWKTELGQFLKPFLDRLGHKARRQMCPLYVSELIVPARYSLPPASRISSCSAVLQNGSHAIPRCSSISPDAHPGSKVEIWFSILEEKSSRFTSVKQLREHIDAFIAAYNENAMPFI